MYDLLYNARKTSHRFNKELFTISVKIFSEGIVL